MLRSLCALDFDLEDQEGQEDACRLLLAGDKHNK